MPTVTGMMTGYSTKNRSFTLDKHKEFRYTTGVPTNDWVVGNWYTVDYSEPDRMVATVKRVPGTPTAVHPGEETPRTSPRPRTTPYPSGVKAETAKPDADAYSEAKAEQAKTMTVKDIEDERDHRTRLTLKK